MQHRIPVSSLGPDGASMARAVETCVHCGFCLPACPTYRVLGEEMDSPRGRIVLMKQVLEGELTMPDALPYVDRCLGCLACVAACPSGVKYEELLVPFRTRAESGGRSWVHRVRRTMALTALESAGRFRVAALAGRLARPFAGALPRALRSMLDLLPAELPAPVTLPSFVPARPPRRARVALLAGCVQQALGPGINMATLRVLSANGVEVVIPPRQGCCGALALHTGFGDRARRLARRTIDAFPRDIDAVVTNAAGCGSALKEYGHLFPAGEIKARAESFAAQVRDVSELLDALGAVTPPPLPEPITLAYHDACHLAHAQGIRGAPRRLLAAIPNVQIAEVADGDICCGSAGMYNVEHPDVAGELGARKAQALVATGAAAAATGNIGCMVQLQAHLVRAGSRMEVLHTIEVLDRAYARQTL